MSDNKNKMTPEEWIRQIDTKDVKDWFNDSVTRSKFENIKDKLTVKQIEVLSENLLNGFEEMEICIWLSKKQIKHINKNLITAFKEESINNIDELDIAVYEGLEWGYYFENATLSGPWDFDHISNKELGLKDDAPKEIRDIVFEEFFPELYINEIIYDLIWDWLNKGNWGIKNESSEEVITYYDNGNPKKKYVKVEEVRKESKEIGYLWLFQDDGQLKKMTRIIKTYHENGNIKEEYEEDNWKVKDGYYRLFHKNGQLKVELNFTNGIQDAGTIISYHNNGVKAREVVLIENGVFNGDFTEWHENGEIITQGIYKNDVCIIKKEFNVKRNNYENS